MEQDQALESGYEAHEENGENRTWILNKGWSMGKKMLITGTVISSAPLILPLLMVISTLGLFCAVPCSFFLACFFCTKKLIATLLPSPKALPAIYEDSRAKDNFEEYGGDADVAKEEEELRHRVDMRLEQDEKEYGEGGVKGKDEIVEKNGKPNEEKQGNVAVELGKRDDSEAKEKPVKEKNEERTDRNVKETEAQSVNGDGGNTNETEASRVKQNQETVAQLGNDRGGNTKESKANRGKKNRKAKSADAGDKQKEGNKKPGLEVTAPSNVDSSGSGGTASKEVLYSEENIWKQIDALRAIIGCSTTRHTTCIDELKALYVFTGIEPPVLFEDPCNLVEISDKLRLFMSIVGVE